MFFSEKEKEKMQPLFLSMNQNDNEIYTIAFSNGDVATAKIDTCYETDNGLEEEDIDFEEYYACALEIIEVLTNVSNTLEKGILIEVNYRNYPQEIKNSKGERL